MIANIRSRNGFNQSSLSSLCSLLTCQFHPKISSPDNKNGCSGFRPHTLSGYVNMKINHLFWLNGTESTCQCRRHKRHVSNPYVGKISWRRKWQHTPVFFLRNFLRGRGAWWLQSISPQGCKVLDTTEWLSMRVHMQREKKIFPPKVLKNSWHLTLLIVLCLLS